MFLDTPEFSYSRLRKLSAHFTRWEKFAEIIYQSRISTGYLLDLLQMETLIGQREMIIQRLYSRFSKIRHIEERIELFIQRLQESESEEFVRFKKGMKSWDHALDTLKEELTDTRTIKVLIRYEQSHQCRPYMLKLLHGRFTNLRRQQELKEIKQWRDKMKKTQKSISESKLKN